jgi:hypothetical protein
VDNGASAPTIIVPFFSALTSFPSAMGSSISQELGTCHSLHAFLSRVSRVVVAWCLLDPLRRHLRGIFLARNGAWT